MSPGLCIHCQYIFENWNAILNDEHLVKAPHCHDIFALQVSAERGCPLCGQFLRNLERRGDADILRNASIELLNNGCTPMRSWIQIVSFESIISRYKYQSCRLLELRFHMKDVKETDRMSVDVISESESESGSESGSGSAYSSRIGGLGVTAMRAHNVYVGKIVMIPSSFADAISSNKINLLSSNSRTALGLARLWLEKCCQLHNNCVSQKSTPTRLLRIDNDILSLCSSATFSSPPKYATLSHCWGSLKLLKLTTKNLRYFEEGVPFGVLCKTFQDAIYVTQQLGLQYLWIDSLCIVQDDPDDWDKEPKLMSIVYGSSTINIAATSAADGSGGLFFERDDKHVWHHQIRTYVNDEWQAYLCVEDEISEACLFQTPLAKRAWVIQERLLASRTLHFSSTQIFWECNSLIACEVFPDAFPGALTYCDFYLHKRPVSKNIWWQIVKLYSICQLTCPEDKLVAISGLARHIYNQNQQNIYCAGLWRQGLEIQLCWKARERTPRPIVPRAPSWSWASVDGTISLGLPPDEPLHVRILEVDISPHSPFGKVLSGRVKLECDFLIPAKIDMESPRPCPQILVGSASPKFRVNLDCWEITQGCVFLLPIGVAVSLYESCFVGLVLQSTGMSQGEYERIGHFEQEKQEFENSCLPHKSQANTDFSEIYEREAQLKPRITIV